MVIQWAGGVEERECLSMTHSLSRAYGSFKCWVLGVGDVLGAGVVGWGVSFIRGPPVYVVRVHNQSLVNIASASCCFSRCQQGQPRSGIQCYQRQ